MTFGGLGADPAAVSPHAHAAPSERARIATPAATRGRRRRGLLLSAGWPPLAAAHAALPPAARARLRRHATPLAAHDLLLARCAVALHHGGSGTTAAALAAGTPQLLVPLQFDQPFWAERVAHLGLSPAPLDAAAIGGGQGGGSLKGGGSGGGSSAGGAGATDDACDAAAALVAGRLMQAVGCEDIRRRCADMAAALQVGAGFAFERALCSNPPCLDHVHCAGVWQNAFACTGQARPAVMMPPHPTRHRRSAASTSPPPPSSSCWGAAAATELVDAAKLINFVGPRHGLSVYGAYKRWNLHMPFSSSLSLCIGAHAGITPRCDRGATCHPGTQRLCAGGLFGTPCTVSLIWSVLLQLSGLIKPTPVQWTIHCKSMQGPTHARHHTLESTRI